MAQVIGAEAEDAAFERVIQTIKRHRLFTSGRFVWPYFVSQCLLDFGITPRVNFRRDTNERRRHPLVDNGM